MMDPTKIRDIVEKALGNAKAAGFGRTEQIEHAVRALRQVDPQVSEEDAITAVRRIMRPA
jgi:hypothetical protein